ncbi:hypothetical protein LTSEMON_5054 [Salmonella enterica subsp. enterica serovar Montevideo str. S5-403]|uniref:Uncharacterized protein n=8 Tax=Enterobacteriaceae TaxID=543 RepID=A0A2S0T0G5_ECOLX|nr:hypothetical protein [Enterobacter cloacae]ALP55140.1 hypothetical protein KPH11_115 [Klebsiella pneumoniae subsp. pneumoniae]APA23002.1 hypothetical protein [Salmonella enterica subsp. enterica serovar Typhimurium]ASO63700.1 hypothetical protein [Citrobacter freundii]AUF80505.1 Hypothetical protein [Raoultella ornithinolytica]AWB15345.1 hypothetical protein [Escherichia coli]EHC73891.1 hypothetical protein LTSEMON_5054 [Salmonella enterica subsp. enterica serovar Montevideo str. S5-403]U
MTIFVTRLNDPFASVQKSNFGWLKTLVYDNVKSVAGIFF